MQNSRIDVGPLLGIVLLSLVLGGCNQNASREQLAEAYRELNSPGPNYIHIANVADAYLADQPTGSAAADAWYLKGRAWEEKAQRDTTTPQMDLTSAYQAYARALTFQPRPALAGLIHTGLGNILYFQEQYAAAIQQLTTGFQTLDNDNSKAWALYRVGLCHQRLGQWDDADRTLSQVQQSYPGTEQARRSREKQGARAFFVQVGAYATPAVADSIVADLKRQGLTALRYADPTGKGPQYVRIGPLPNYASAQAMKQRIWSKYASAAILP